MDFTRLECRDLLANVNKLDVDPDVLAKLSAGASAVGGPASFELARPSTPASYAAPAVAPDGMPPFTPIVYSDGELARLNSIRKKTITDEFPEGLPPVTQADVTEANRVKYDFHVNEWTMQKNYKPNLNVNDVVNAAFAPPDRPPGFTPDLEKVGVGDRARNGDLCERIDSDGESIFRCPSGHGYKFSLTIRSCPTCFIKGGAAAEIEREDPGAIAGSESRW